MGGLGEKHRVARWVNSIVNMNGLCCKLADSQATPLDCPSDCDGVFWSNEPAVHHRSRSTAVWHLSLPSVARRQLYSPSSGPHTANVVSAHRDSGVHIAFNYGQ